MERCIAVYARQSIDKKESLSVEGQIELCIREAGPGAQIQVYEDRGYSGKNVKRPAFTRLMADVEAGRVAKIICYRLDRISRSISDFGHIWEMFSGHGVEFVSVNERFDTATPMGRAMLYIIMVFAQLERETIAERIKDNYYQRVRRGTWPGGPAPYGFDIERARGRSSRLVANGQASVIPRLFAQYAVQGASLGSVCRWLNGQGIPCAQRQRWDTASLGRLLRHPAYVRADASVYAYYKAKGLIMANEIEAFDGRKGCILVGKRASNERKYTQMAEHLLALAEHEGVVDAQSFLACQHKLDTNKAVKNTGKGKYTWLSGLLKCGQCGYSLRVVHDARAGRCFLVCSGRSNLGLCDHRHSERLEELELAAGQLIQHYLLDVTPIGKPPANHSDTRAELALLDDKIATLVARISESSPVTMGYINAELERLDAGRQALLARLAADSGPGETAGQLADICLDALPFEDKKAIAATLLERVVCTAQGAEFVWRTSL